MATKGYWKSGAVDSPPDTSTLTSKGYPTSGDPKTGTPATKPGAAWYYLQDQMRNSVIEAAGQELTEPPSATQFLEALRSMAWLADNTIPGGKIANASITGAKLAAKTVAEGNLADLSVSTAKLAAGGVTGDKIAQGAVDGARLAAQSVTFSHLLPALIATEGQVTEGTAKNVLMTPFLTRLMVGASRHDHPLRRAHGPERLAHLQRRECEPNRLRGPFRGYRYDLRCRQRVDNLWPAEFGRSLPRRHNVHWFCRHLPLSGVTEHHG